MLWKISLLFLASEQLHTGTWGWAPSPATQYSDWRRGPWCRQESPPSPPQPPHPLLGKLQEAPGHTSRFQNQENKRVISPLHPSLLPQEAWRKLANVLAFHSGCQVPLLFLHFLRDCQHNFPPAGHVTGNAVLYLWAPNDYLIPGLFCFTGSQVEDRKAALF